MTKDRPGIVPKTALRPSKLPHETKRVHVKKYIPEVVEPLQGGGSGPTTGVKARRFRPGKEKP